MLDITTNKGNFVRFEDLQLYMQEEKLTEVYLKCMYFGVKVWDGKIELSEVEKIINGEVNL